MSELCTTKKRSNNCKKLLCIGAVHVQSEFALTNFIAVKLTDAGCGYNGVELIFEGLKLPKQFVTFSERERRVDNYCLLFVTNCHERYPQH